MTTEDFSLRSGTQLGHYRITKILGRGGFGITYQAWDDHLNRLVAIKEYFPHGQATRADDSRTVRINDADAPAYRKGLERFLDEARTLAQFRDPRIVHVHGFQEAHNTAYMVMDFEEGVSLRDHVLQRGALSPAEAKRTLGDILLALQVLHLRNYLHRDIKPANLMRRPDGSLLLLDFGSARITQAHQDQAFTVIVTPGYAPMEQYTATEIQGPATDLYATGACLLFCLTCSSPIDAMKRMIAEQASERDPLEPVLANLVARNPDYAEITSVLRWLLQGKANLRPQSAGEVLQRLGLANQPAFTPIPTPLPDPGQNTLVLVPARQPGLPAPIDLTVMRSIPSKLVEPMRQQLQSMVGERATQILFQSIRSARNAQHLIENISAQIEHEPRREQAIQSITQLLAEASRIITVEAVPVTMPGAQSGARDVASPPPGDTPSGQTRPTMILKDEETTQLLSGELAKFIGPIAKMLVKKRLAKAASIQELISQLEEEISVPADRAAFRKAVIKLKILPA